MKKVFDIERLRTPGILLGTTSPSFLGEGIRACEVGIEEGLGDGIEALFNSRIASHALLTYVEHDLLMGMEENPPRIRKVNLSVFTTNDWKDHIVFAAEPPFLRNNYELQEKVLKWMDEQFKKKIKYNFGGLFHFIGLTKNEKNKEYCSQFDKEYLKFLISQGCQFTIPKEWEDKVSPYDLQKWLTKMGWMIPFIKVVPDDYQYNKPVEETK